MDSFKRALWVHLVMSFCSYALVFGQEFPKGRPNLTQEQEKCMKTQLGDPESGGRPDFAKIQKAFKECTAQKQNSGAKRGETPTAENTQPKATQKSSATEAGHCSVCQKDPKTSGSLKDLADVASASQTHVSHEKEVAMKRHLASQKRRALRKIRKMPCPRPGDDNEDLMPMMENFQLSPDTAGDGIQSLELNDEIQEAIDKKMDRCQREAERQMESREMMTEGDSPMRGKMRGDNPMPSMMGNRQMNNAMGLTNFSGQMSTMGMNNFNGLGQMGPSAGYGSMQGQMNMGSAYGMMGYPSYPMGGHDSIGFSNGMNFMGSRSVPMANGIWNPMVPSYTFGYMGSGTGLTNGGYTNFVGGPGFSYSLGVQNLNPSSVFGLPPHNFNWRR